MECTVRPDSPHTLAQVLHHALDPGPSGAPRCSAFGDRARNSGTGCGVRPGQILPRWRAGYARAFHGVEQRPHLVEVSRSFAHQYAIPRVHFLCANAGDLDWGRYDAFYFYNPFYENLDPDKKLDERVELSPSLYDQYIRMTQERLAQAPPGTRVVTFHGMGGDMPDGYEQVLQEFQDIGFLELWIKSPSPEELISIQRISRGPEGLQAPCFSVPAGARAETRLWVSICASTPDKAHTAED